MAEIRDEAVKQDLREATIGKSLICREIVSQADAKTSAGRWRTAVESRGRAIPCEPERSSGNCYSLQGVTRATRSHEVCAAKPEYRQRSPLLVLKNDRNLVKDYEAKV
ncbi:hypothetical protein CHS0354_005313 [Potamilus streckersoni]|uniref:Uncharacterized protein n=1 Tax=Potamilus streckersoni TaxID=2493646 RepID=A0AAE0VW59_9BIVA|nr:hypothetical protein CHS0354_005313 [Potamilus streckersoni]